MSPFTAPYDDEAAKLVKSIKTIFTTIKQNGMGTTAIMTVLGELMMWAGEATSFQALPTEEKKRFFVEVFDQAIGDEEHAIVNQLGFLQGASLEQVTDALKGVFLAYMENKGLV